MSTLELSEAGVAIPVPSGVQVETQLAKNNRRVANFIFGAQKNDA
jgi:hypothetical protein